MAITVAAGINSQGALSGAAQFNAALASMRRELVNSSRQLQDFQAKLNAVRPSMAASSASVGAFGMSLSRLGPAISAFAGYKIAQWAVQASDAFSLLTARLGNVAREGTTATALLNAIGDAAQRARMPALDMAQIYQRNANALKDLGRSEADGIRLTETLAKVITISGVSAQEARSAMIQLSQAIVSNRLQGDEFRSVSENMPEILRILQRETGKTAAELRKLAKEGRITGEVLVNSLLNASQSVDEKFAKMPVTAAQGFAMLKDNLTRTFGEIAAGNGVSQRFAELFQKISDLIRSPSFAEGATLFAKGVASIGEAMTALVGAIPAAINWTKAFIDTLRETSVYKTAASWIQSIVEKFQTFAEVGNRAIESAANVAANAIRSVLPTADEFLSKIQRAAELAGTMREMAGKLGANPLTPSENRERLPVNFGPGNTAAAERAGRNATRIAELEALRAQHTRALINGQEDLAHKLQDELELRQKISDSMRNISPALRQQMADQIALQNELQRQLVLSNKLRDIGRETFRSISDSIMQGVAEGKKFSEVLKGIASKLIEIAARAAFLGPLEKAFGNSFANVFSGFNPDKGLIGGLLGNSSSFNSAGGWNTTVSSGGAFSGLTSLFGFANGGVQTGSGMIVAGGTQRPIAENGPEAVLPLQRGADGRLGVAMNGGAPGGRGDVHIHINGDATDATIERFRRVARQEVLEASPSIVRQSVDSVAREHRSDPRYLRR